MTDSFALDAYFDRIGWQGEAPPTLATLAGLLSAHMRSIPFEHLDVLLDRPIRFDLDSLQRKLVRAKRGGYCFEHAALFSAVLERLGFRPISHSARVVLYSPRTQSPRAHMFLTVNVGEQSFVFDPGFGGGGSLFPVPLVGSCGRPEGATHWMAQDGDYWIMRTISDAKVIDQWVSTLEHDCPIDFEMANHFTATHPGSPFRNRLMLSLFTRDGRVSLMNQDFTIRKGDRSISGKLASRAALRIFMAEHFGFDFPDVDKLHVPFIPEWN